MSSVLVLGSLNVDHVINLGRIPVPGETMHAESYFLGPGGKGLNQAVAVKKILPDERCVVGMAGLVGSDGGAAMLKEHLLHQGIDISMVTTTSQTSTGAAFIQVDKTGENMIILHGGANMAFTASDLQDAAKIPSRIAQASALLMQLEIPMPAVERAAEIAAAAGTKVLLNPAPIKPLSVALLANVDYLVVNELEAAAILPESQEHLTDTTGGKPWARRVGEALLAKGVKTAVIVTQGSKSTGATFRNAQGTVEYVEAAPPLITNVVDTTAAGDAFIGAFVATLVSSDWKAPMAEVLKVANAAGALTVMHRGAAESIPVRAQLDQFLLSLA